MQGMHLYEYAVIRVLPKVEREEFINVGVILFSKKAKYIGFKYYINRERLSLFSGEIDFDLIETNMQSFEKICQGCNTGGQIATFDIPERFRWITAVKSSCIQSSRPHPGFSKNLDETLDRLFAELVL